MAGSPAARVPQPAGQAALPRLALLREMTDRAVLDRVFAAGRVTRTELAGLTGISKPTISESVRRLEAAGVLRAGGIDQTGRRGRIATFYEVAADAGYVLAAEVNQHGVHTLAANLAGVTVDERRHGAVRPGDRAALAEAVRATMAAAVAASAGHGPPRAVAVSVANPVDPVTREVIALPNSPFPEGRLPVRETVAGLVDPAPLLVDNDVNFSALAERRTGAASAAESFVYLYLGAGLGMSFYHGDQLVRGAHGLAGEIGYLVAGDAGDASAGPVRLAEAIAGLGFGRADGPALDVAAIHRALAGAAAGDTRAGAVVRRLGAAVARAVAAACVVVDPDLVVLGGPVGTHPGLLEPVRAEVAAAALPPVRIEPGAVTEFAPLRGALVAALDTGRAALPSLPGAG
ncbi:MAG TPA: ROK family transcriptional regulator [Pseudonocardia sp.]|nr:ROK family transcriptional regulator [Pseudonocardia sp.]